MKAERRYATISAKVRIALTLAFALVYCVAPLQAQQTTPAADKTPPATTTQNGAATSSGMTSSGMTSSAPASAPAATGASTGQEDNLFVNTDLVKLTVTVTDSYDRFVTGIDRNAFSIFDNKIEQEILFFNDEDAPASVGILFDFSGSMSGDKVMRAREALKRFLNTSHEKDEYFLIGFNSRAQLLLDRTRDSDALLNKLTFVETKGNTALYDATYLGVEKVTRGIHDKRVLLIISDGQDNNSRYTFNEVRRLMKESGVLIYSIGITSPNNTNTLDAGGQAILDELSGVSGGKAFFPTTTAEMNEIFERISLELRSQYSISYRPTPFAVDGKWRRVKVKVQPPRGLPRLFVRNKEGYFAVTNPR